MKRTCFYGKLPGKLLQEKGGRKRQRQYANLLAANTIRYDRERKQREKKVQEQGTGVQGTGVQGTGESMGILGPRQPRETRKSSSAHRHRTSDCSHALIARPPLLLKLLPRSLVSQSQRNGKSHVTRHCCLRVCFGGSSGAHAMYWVWKWSGRWDSWWSK